MDGSFVFQNLEGFNTGKVVKQLGEGGFSFVYLYECDDNSSRKVVVKRFKSDAVSLGTEDPELKRKLLLEILHNEFDIGKVLNHEHIIKTLDIDVPNSSIAFEHFSGMDMLEYLEKVVPIDFIFLLRCFGKVLDAVKYLHDMGIAHMDIKLENILLDYDTQQVKLIDFGQAKRFQDPNTRMYIYSRHACGTQEYFPPEFFKRIAFRPEKVDVWCCGLVLYNIVYDRMPWSKACPFRDKNYYYCKSFLDIGELYNKVFTNIPLNLSSEDSTVIFDLFSRMFQSDYEERPTIQDIQQDFGRLHVLELI